MRCKRLGESSGLARRRCLFPLYLGKRVTRHRSTSKTASLALSQLIVYTGRSICRDAAVLDQIAQGGLLRGASLNVQLYGS